MTTQSRLIEAVDRLEDELAKYFIDKEIPLEIQSAIAGIEIIIQEISND